jgi:hypothetical protein
MKLQNETRIKRVKEELLRGCTRGYIESRLSKEFRLAPATIGHFITAARKQMKEDAREKKELLAQIRREQIEEIADSLVASGVEAEAFLTQILRGEIMEEKIVYTEKGPQVMKVAPKIKDMIEIIKMVFHNQHRCGREENPPELAPLGYFLSDMPFNEVQMGDREPLTDYTEEEENNSLSLDEPNKEERASEAAQSSPNPVSSEQK